MASEESDVDDEPERSGIEYHVELVHLGGELEYEVLADALESIGVEERAVAAATHVEFITVVRQPGAEERREEDVHVRADEKVVTGGIEIGVVVEGHQFRVEEAVVSELVANKSIEPL